MSKGSQTTTTQTGPPPNVSAAYNQLISNTQSLANTPYVPYTGEGVAPVNQQQYYGIGNINANALAAQPDYSLAGGYFKDAAAPLTPDQIMTYYDPFQQNVIKTTQEQFDQMNQRALNNIQGNAGVQGALGGDRSAVADAAYYQGALPGQEQAIASLEAQGYTNAAAMAAGQFQQNPMYAGYGLANLGTGAQQAALQGASAQLAAGGLEQQTSQALDQYLYNQYLAQQGFPFMENQYAAGIIGGIGSLSGGYGTTTAPAPSVFAQLLGLGTAGAGAYGAYQGAQNKTSAAGGRVKGYQTGGSPVMPYSGAQSYVPSGQLGLGRSTLPTPPQAPGQQSGASGMFGEASQLAGMGKMGQGLGSGLGNLFGGSAAAADPTEAAIAGTGLPMDIAAGAGDATGALAAGDMAASAGDAAMLFLLAQGGGRINYPGGLALPGKNRIQMPMRGGMGMPSFVRGYQGGGTPSFADRFEGDPNYGEIYLAQQKAREAYDPKPVPTTTIPASQIAGDPIPGDVSTSSAGVYTDDTGDLPGRTPVGSKIAPAGLAYAPENAPPGGGIYAPSGVKIAPPGLAYAPENAPPGGGIYAPSGVAPSPLPPRMEPRPRPQIVPGQGGQGFLGMSPEFWASLIPAGLGMMAAAQPGVPTGVAIGRGGLEGFSAYGSMKKGEADIEMQARKLDDAAKAEQDRIATENRPYQEMTQYQKVEAGLPKPYPGYETPEGHPVMMTRSGQLIDAITHQPVDPNAGLKNTRFAYKPLPGKITDLGNPVLYSGDPQNPQMMDAVTKEPIGPGSPRTIQDLRYAPIPDEDAKARGHQLAIGDINSAYKGMGYGANPNSQRVYHAALAELTKDGGMTTEQAAEYLSAQQQEWHARGMGLSAEARTAATREANLNIILKAADAAVPAALEQSDKVGRTGFVPLNQLIQKGEVMTSDPEMLKFGMANLQLAEHWARAMNPTGQMRESDRDLALKYLDVAQGPEAYRAAVRQLQMQIQREKSAVSSFRQEHGASAPMGKSDAITYGVATKELNDKLPGNAASTVGAAPAAGKPQTVTQNGHTYTLQADGSYK